jgi:hypothetical protein
MNTCIGDHYWRQTHETPITDTFACVRCGLRYEAHTELHTANGQTLHVTRKPDGWHLKDTE